MDDTMIDIAVEKFFKMLSAYLITTAIMSPPPPCVWNIRHGT